jgi:adenosylcobinamide amidohydrolase
VGTINLLVLVDAPLDDAALVAAVQTATEAKAQALADAGVAAINHDGPATGTATDSVCVAVHPGGGVAFAGPATDIGAAIALAVHDAVRAGAVAHRRVANGTVTGQVAPTWRVAAQSEDLAR